MRFGWSMMSRGTEKVSRYLALRYSNVVAGNADPSWISSAEAAAFLRVSSRQNLAQQIGVSLDLVLTNSAGERLQFKVVAILRMRRAPGQAHGVLAVRAGRRIHRTKAAWHCVASLGLGRNQPSTSTSVPHARQLTGESAVSCLDRPLARKSRHWPPPQRRSRLGS